MRKKKCVVSNIVEEMLGDIQELKEKVHDVDNLCCEPIDICYQRKRQILKRQASSPIESSRLKRRKLSSQGHKSKLRRGWWRSYSKGNRRQNKLARQTARYGSVLRPEGEEEELAYHS